MSENREPRALNIPNIVLAFGGALVVIHAIRIFLLSQQRDIETILLFAFVPARYLPVEPGGLTLGQDFPGGFAADIWTFVSYGLLHADWAHLFVNLLWMVAFGSAVAARFGAARFMSLTIAATIGGALLHLATRWGDLSPMIGASAAVSGHMGAAIRFALTGPGPMVGSDPHNQRAYAPAVSLIEALKERRVIAFLAVWFGVNFLFGTGVVSLGGEDVSVAWEAHIGGFLVGMLGFAFFDPPRPPPQPWEIDFYSSGSS